MSLKIARPAILFLLLTILLFSTGAATSSYQYTRLGDKADSTTTPVAGTAMMGGGKDLDEAFRWLCKKANGGDFLVLRARGDDDYNSYVNGMCKVNSVATLIIPDLAAAQDPAVADMIRHAEAVFIAGGNQARYVEFWKGTPVEDAINANVASGKPIGGTRKLRQHAPERGLWSWICQFGLFGDQGLQVRGALQPATKTSSLTFSTTPTSPILIMICRTAPPWGWRGSRPTFLPQIR